MNVKDNHTVWLIVGASGLVLGLSIAYLGVVVMNQGREIEDLRGNVSPGDDIIAMRAQLNLIGENGIKLDRLLAEYNLGLEFLKADMKARTELRYTKEDAARDWNAINSNFERLEARIRKLEKP